MTPVAITERAEHCVQSSTFEITGAPLSAEELRKPPPSCRKAHGRGRPPGISCLRKKLCQVVALGCLLGSVTLAQNVQRKFRPGTNLEVSDVQMGRGQESLSRPDCGRTNQTNV